jgi:L-serine dehydratase
MKNIVTFKQLLEVTIVGGKRTYEAFQELEAHVREKTVQEVRSFMGRNLEVMEASINSGLSQCKASISGMSGEDAQRLLKRYQNGNKTAFNSLLGKILIYSVAILEENQRMGRIVSCPTAGSCGIVPSVIIAYAQEYGFDEEQKINALITAGGIGKIIAQQIELAGATYGCQAECGVASAMAAGAAVELMGGDNEQIIHAATLALKNLMGLVCDPVAGLVEVPCIKRNGFLAVHAVTASEMALAGVKSFIPPDEVLKAVKQVGNMMSPMLKESSEAGLAVTETASKLAARFSRPE